MKRPVSIHRGDEVREHVARLRGFLGVIEAASAPCVRAVGYDHRYCCVVHATAGADHGDFPEGTDRCRAWPEAAP